MNQNNFHSIEEIYSEIQDCTDRRDYAYSLLNLRSFYINLCTFDHKTGEPLYSDFEYLTNNINDFKFGENNKDYLDKIIDHTYSSIKYILLNPREKILREHQIIPIYAAREVDNTSVQWLSRRSGRNLREKLAEKPYIKAVKRRFSYDTIENRLFKAFLINLKNLLIVKADADLLKEENSIELLELIERWLHTNEVKEIASWKHVPPNNTLMQDKHYRKIWDSWLWIQGLDDTIKKDSAHIENNFLTTISWILLSELNSYNEMRFLQQPVFFDYDLFDIKVPKLIHGILYTKQKNQPVLLKKETLSYKLVIGSMISIVISINDNKINISFNNKVSNYDYSYEALLKIKEDFRIFLEKKYYITKNKISKFNIVVSKSSVLDLNLIYPKIITLENSEITLPYRFIEQYWEDKNKDLITLDCSNANALLIDSTISTVSMNNLFSDDIMDNSHIFLNTLNKFTKDISSYIKSDEISYLVSDRISEFSSEKLRKSMNYAFSNASPLPRSVATVFHFQSTEFFMQSNFKSDDCVIVIESTPDHISATKLLSKYNEEIDNRLNSTKGITWVRYPSININSIIPKKIFQNTLNTTIAEDISNIWGKDGVLLDSNSFTWVTDKDHWFTYAEKNQLNDIRIDFREVKESLSLKDEQKLKVILIGEYASELKLKNYLPLPLILKDKLLDGANLLNKWQKQVPEVSLWEDYLPELSFNIPKDGIYQDLYLVKDTTIIPLKGKQTEIIIEESLTLPRGKNYYEFPLQLDSGDKELQFIAYLRSSNLPLEKDVNCKLKMIYTYGADDPYELYFIPKDSEDLKIFRSIKVEWKKRDNSIIKEAPIPDFPKRYEWKDFENFYNQKDNRANNLLIKIQKNIDIIIDFENKYNMFLSGKDIYAKDNRVCCDISNLNWSQAGNGDWFCRLLLNNNKEIFIHQNNYRSFSKDYKNISFDIKEERGGLIAKHITKGRTLVRSLDADKLKRNIRFPMTTVWNQIHSLSDYDIPMNFRKIIQDGIKSSISLLNNKNIDSNLKRLLIFFLSCLHQDTPPIIINILLKYSDEGTHNNEISYAIGNANLDWQKSIFINSINLNNSFKTIEILSKSLWRAETLIYKLSHDNINQISDKILLNLKSKNIGPLSLTQNLEVLLVLLRTRGSDDEEINQIFALNSKITSQFIDLIEKITKKVFDEKLKINTRITFNLSKPESLSGTPDILYALRLYLTGDDRANSIEVTEVSDE